ncbi:Hemerythrin HHE cation binding domain-containing protein [Georgenia satyanarayanai]|uniref:Hemerythrin HHE cation binding domain-containing protein n=1 Tax=Georgenia satyanarayanai TaxID=860221 RepID=A0A2Y9AQH8_9MICO|nr:hemerythrin domain-containing protein [Georgenia satyanarayanai]PYF98879.1 hemerythrin HHE cation binding domain-containing protein [Georgenia satyanarayanai]SSA44727.1 Hemerythrin HHE cation binding domain-containing protein [Georgenia satyanarayanai]
MSRFIADQTVAELGGWVSVLTRQKKDHVTLDRLLHDLHRTSGEEQAAVIQRIYRLVFPHAFAEESVLWPTLRRVLPDGHELSLEVEQEHQEVNELVTRLEGMGHGDPERGAVLDRVTVVLRDDVRDEEDVLLPRLQQAVSARDLRRPGVLWEVVRRVSRPAPTPSSRAVPRGASSRPFRCPCSTGCATSSTPAPARARSASAPGCARPAAGSRAPRTPSSTFRSCATVRTRAPAATAPRKGATLTPSADSKPGVALRTEWDR